VVNEKNIEKKVKPKEKKELTKKKIKPSKNLSKRLKFKKRK
jgi:hypothetical protein